MITDERKQELRRLAVKLAGQFPEGLEECEFILASLRVQIHLTFHGKLPSDTGVDD